MRRKDLLIPPINFLRFEYDGRCPYCEISDTVFFDEGRNPEESNKLRKEGKVKPLYYCELKPSVKGLTCCSDSDWAKCPLHCKGGSK